MTESEIRRTVARRSQTRHNYDRMSRWYDLFTSSEKRFTEAGLRMLNVQPGETVLEIGCGTGHSLVSLAKAVGEKGVVWGLDISSGMLKKAQARLHRGGYRNTRLCLAEALDPPFPGRSFDILFLSFTLELFGDEEIPIVLAECRNLLYPGGRIGVVALKKDSRQAVRIYEWFHARAPSIIDCRPIFPSEALSSTGFELINSVENSMWGLPVEMAIARRK